MTEPRRGKGKLDHKLYIASVRLSIGRLGTAVILVTTSSLKFQIEERVQDALDRRTVDANVPISNIDGGSFVYQFVSQLIVVVGYVNDGIRDRDP